MSSINSFNSRKSIFVRAISKHLRHIALHHHIDGRRQSPMWFSFLQNVKWSDFYWAKGVSCLAKHAKCLFLSRRIVGILMLLAVITYLASTVSAASHSVRDFGAVGDGKTLDTVAIQNALDTVANDGGGEVLIPAGRYITGSLILKSHATLRLEEGATLFGSPNPNDYPIIRARWEGIETNCHRALISANAAEDITITGLGVIEGCPKVGQLRNPRGPTVIEFNECTNVCVEEVTIKSSRMWTLHPAYCHNVRILRVTVETTGSNSDGIDPDSCQMVLIDGCTFSTGDDNIAIKSGKGQEGARIGRPCEDIVITNCTFLKGYTSIAFGSELSGGIRRVHISNCTFKQGRAALQFKSRSGRGAYLEDITADHLVVGPEPLLEMTTNYRFNPDPQGVPGIAGLTRFSNIRISDVQIDAKQLMSVEGTTEKPVDGLYISRVTGTVAAGSDIQHASNVVLADIRLDGISGPHYFTNNVSGIGFKSAAPINERPSQKDKSLADAH